MSEVLRQLKSCPFHSGIRLPRNVPQNSHTGVVRCTPSRITPYRSRQKKEKNFFFGSCYYRGHAEELRLEGAETPVGPPYSVAKAILLCSALNRRPARSLASVPKAFRVNDRFERGVCARYGWNMLQLHEPEALTCFPGAIRPPSEA